MISIPIDGDNPKKDSHNEFSGLIDGAANIAKATIIASILMIGGIVALIIYLTIKAGKSAAKNPERAMDLAERGVGIAAKAKSVK